MNEYIYPSLEPIQFESKFKVRCPVCNDDYVHHESSAIVLDGRDNCEADKSVRGDVVQIPMWCEGGRHRFSLKLGFHKGQTDMWCTYHGEKIV